jgi:hypothetical protein
MSPFHVREFVTYLVGTRYTEYQVQYVLYIPVLQYSIVLYIHTVRLVLIYSMTHNLSTIGLAKGVWGGGLSQ